MTLPGGDAVESVCLVCVCGEAGGKPAALKGGLEAVFNAQLRAGEKVPRSPVCCFGKSEACSFLTPRAGHELEFQLSAAVTGSQEHHELLPFHSCFSFLLHHQMFPSE